LPPHDNRMPRLPRNPTDNILGKMPHLLHAYATANRASTRGSEVGIVHLLAAGLLGGRLAPFPPFNLALDRLAQERGSLLVLL
jgi:hypothetical protein